MDLGSLADLKRRAGVRDGTGVPSDYLSSITRQMTLGLAYLHERKLLHRDIKPENILHNRAGEVKLSDFGIAKDLDKTIAMAGTFVGTVTYMSPERCLGQDYSFASDIWSVGMVIFELSTGRYPFADIASFPVLFQHLCEMPEPRLDPSLCPPALVDFAGVCLTRDVARRPDTDVLLLHDYVMVDVCTQAISVEALVTFHVLLNFCLGCSYHSRKDTTLQLVRIDISVGEVVGRRVLQDKTHGASPSDVQVPKARLIHGHLAVNDFDILDLIAAQLPGKDALAGVRQDGVVAAGPVAAGAVVMPGVKAIPGVLAAGVPAAGLLQMVPCRLGGCQHLDPFRTMCLGRVAAMQFLAPQLNHPQPLVSPRKAKLSRHRRCRSPRSLPDKIAGGWELMVKPEVDSLAECLAKQSVSRGYITSTQVNKALNAFNGPHAHNGLVSERGDPSWLHSPKSLKLRSIDTNFTSYFQILEENYDTVDQIRRLYTAWRLVDRKRSGEPKYFDPNPRRGYGYSTIGTHRLFFQDNHVTDPGHRRLFKKWFADEWDQTPGSKSTSLTKFHAAGMAFAEDQAGKEDASSEASAARAEQEAATARGAQEAAAAKAVRDAAAAKAVRDAATARAAQDAAAAKAEQEAATARAAQEAAAARAARESATARAAQEAAAAKDAQEVAAARAAEHSAVDKSAGDAFAPIHRGEDTDADTRQSNWEARSAMFTIWCYNLAAGLSEGLLLAARANLLRLVRKTPGEGEAGAQAVESSVTSTEKFEATSTEKGRLYKRKLLSSPAVCVTAKKRLLEFEAQEVTAKTLACHRPKGSGAPKRAAAKKAASAASASRAVDAVPLVSTEPTETIGGPRESEAKPEQVVEATPEPDTPSARPEGELGVEEAESQPPEAESQTPDTESQPPDADVGDADASSGQAAASRPRWASLRGLAGAALEALSGASSSSQVAGAPAEAEAAAAAEANGGDGPEAEAREAAQAAGSEDVDMDSGPPADSQSRIPMAPDYLMLQRCSHNSLRGVGVAAYKTRSTLLADQATNLTDVDMDSGPPADSQSRIPMAPDYLMLQRCSHNSLQGVAADGAEPEDPEAQATNLTDVDMDSGPPADSQSRIPMAPDYLMLQRCSHNSLRGVAADGAEPEDPEAQATNLTLSPKSISRQEREAVATAMAAAASCKTLRAWSADPDRHSTVNLRLTHLVFTVFRYKLMPVPALQEFLNNSARGSAGLVSGPSVMKSHHSWPALCAFDCPAQFQVFARGFVIPRIKVLHAMRLAVPKPFWLSGFTCVLLYLSRLQPSPQTLVTADFRHRQSTAKLTYVTAASDTGSIKQTFVQLCNFTKLSTRHAFNRTGMHSHWDLCAESVLRDCAADEVSTVTDKDESERPLASTFQHQSNVVSVHVWKVVGDSCCSIITFRLADMPQSSSMSATDLVLLCHELLCFPFSSCARSINGNKRTDGLLVCIVCIACGILPPDGDGDVQDSRTAASAPDDLRTSRPSDYVVPAIELSQLNRNNIKHGDVYMQWSAMGLRYRIASKLSSEARMLFQLDFQQINNQAAAERPSMFSEYGRSVQLRLRCVSCNPFTKVGGDIDIDDPESVTLEELLGTQRTTEHAQTATPSNVEASERETANGTAQDAPSKEGVPEEPPWKRGRKERRPAPEQPPPEQPAAEQPGAEQQPPQEPPQPQAEPQQPQAEQQQPQQQPEQPPQQQPPSEQPQPQQTPEQNPQAEPQTDHPREAEPPKSSNSDQSQQSSEQQPQSQATQQPQPEPQQPQPEPEQNAAPPAQAKMPTCHYEALEIRKNASAAEIKKAYYTQSRKLHPDKNKDDPHATARFQCVSEAYQTLSDAPKRAHYDANRLLEKAFCKLGIPVDQLAVQFVLRCCQVPGNDIQEMIVGTTDCFRFSVLVCLQVIAAN
ncbi:unnamed protein product [Polarella glacialis]|uniref:Uncharacterized protein n=2 Tax=Polarella glacialis TaxID=89957 RepID=A0A813G2S4_POLGL|nr:unnamed protein product [Polarella glacialis]